jgi:3D (Asp-Asp-Asp) domain-containing protein
MNKGINKLMIAAVALVLIIAIAAGYFMWANNEANIALDTVRDNLSSTINELNITKDELAITQENLLAEIAKSNELTTSLEYVNNELEEANTTINDLKSEEYKLVYLGNYSITHYCTEKYKHICGTGNGVTSTGTAVTAGRTVAVDPSVIPYGTKLYVEGYGWRVAEDCGGAVNGRHIDMAVDTHANADAMGSRNSGVWILVKN